MKHCKEWHTCDRCGKEIDYLKMELLFSKTKSKITIYPKYPAMKEYELCEKCTSDFEKFMKRTD